MIDSLVSTIISSTTTTFSRSVQPTAEPTTEQSGTGALAETGAVEPTESGSTDHDDDHDSYSEAERFQFSRTAKNLIKHALQDFRKDLRESFRDLGFNGGLANQITKGVIHATRDALRTGIDFSAKLLVAAVSQTTSGSTSSFNLVASSIEVNINHATGSIDVSASNVSIEAQINGELDGSQPHLLDIQDSDPLPPPELTGELLTLDDLDVVPDDEEDDDGSEVTLPEIDTPLLLSGSESAARFFITAYEQFTNDSEERITFIRFDAIVPLSSLLADDTEAQGPVTDATDTDPDGE